MEGMRAEPALHIALGRLNGMGIQGQALGCSMCLEIDKYCYIGRNQKKNYFIVSLKMVNAP